MIRSMTGYGRAEFANEDLKITVEIKSVNNRYLDIGIKMPRQLGMLESSIRAELKKYIGRGKVDVYITYEDLQEANMQVKYNSKIAGEYLRYLRQMAEEYGLDNDIRVSSLSKYPDVFTMEEEPMDPVQLWESLRAVVCEAAENFLQARTREGEFLRNDLMGKLDEMQSHVDFITERSPQIVAAYKQRLYEKVKELIGDGVIDDSRIRQNRRDGSPAVYASSSSSSMRIRQLITVSQKYFRSASRFFCFHSMTLTRMIRNRVTRCRGMSSNIIASRKISPPPCGL